MLSGLLVERIWVKRVLCKIESERPRGARVCCLCKNSFHAARCSVNPCWGSHPHWGAYPPLSLTVILKAKLWLRKLREHSSHMHITARKHPLRLREISLPYQPRVEDRDSFSTLQSDVCVFRNVLFHLYLCIFSALWHNHKDVTNGSHGTFKV